MVKKIGGLALVVLAALFLVATTGTPARASDPSIVDYPNPVTTDANGDFCFYVKVRNNGSTGDVELHPYGSAEITGLTVQPEDHQFYNGEEYSYKVCGHLNGRSGTVKLKLRYVDERGNIVEKAATILSTADHVVKIVHR